MVRKLKKNFKILIILFLFFILIIWFFYPKYSVVEDDSFTATLKNVSFYKNKHCSCLGFEKIKEGLSRSDTFIKVCYGLNYNCSYECKKLENNIWKKVECK